MLNYFQERFGIVLGAFEGFMLLERPQAYWLLTLSPHAFNLGKLRIHTAGIPVLRRIKNFLKPTTTALQTFGKNATRNVVQCDKHQLARLLKGHGVYTNLSIEPGYVVLCHGDHILGCGLYTGRVLLSQIPRSFLPRR
ncbi:MAG: hypothetical protein JRH07_01285 [Deltaproteobacteria bacterium]|nr:hypothetical protein [Deltaproteobacteria bacterium]MBW2120464.1 hypothetical protein [Deltaproteobacteria bacterium]